MFLCRCVQLAWTLGHDNPALWVELISKIKDGILSAFDFAVSQREEEVRRSENQRLMPGWNFCTFFILKVMSIVRSHLNGYPTDAQESLANSFEGMNLLGDALLQYSELEVTFSHVLREKNLSWFGTLIVPTPMDDSLPLLSTTKKPYRDLILANTISVFDLRIYLISRQCSLLGQLGRVSEVCRKSHAFLTSFSRRLRDVEVRVANLRLLSLYLNIIFGQVILPSYFIESWVYSSALSVIERADSWNEGAELEATTLATFYTSKAELLELARSQVSAG